MILKLLKNNLYFKKVYFNNRNRIVFSAASGFIFNLIYALYNGILGIFTKSLWLVTLSAYYIILSTLRFFTVLYDRRNSKKPDNSENFVMKFCGVLIIILSFVLSGSMYLSLTRDVAVKYHEIIMISIALYTFIKITVAIINVVKVQKTQSMLLSAIRNISCADAAASIVSLQRSMIASFGDINSKNSFVMCSITGGFICLFILILGIRMTVISKSVN